MNTLLISSCDFFPSQIPPTQCHCFGYLGKVFPSELPPVEYIWSWQSSLPVEKKKYTYFNLTCILLLSSYVLLYGTPALFHKGDEKYTQCCKCGLVSAIHSDHCTVLWPLAQTLNVSTLFMFHWMCELRTTSDQQIFMSSICPII